MDEPALRPASLTSLESASRRWHRPDRPVRILTDPVFRVTTVSRSEPANRLVPLDGNALAFGTLFSSQGASDAGAPKKNPPSGAPTAYLRSASKGRQPRRPPGGTSVPTRARRTGFPVRSARSPAVARRYTSRTNRRRPTDRTFPRTASSGSSTRSTTVPSRRTPPPLIARRASELDSANPTPARTLGT